MQFYTNTEYFQVLLPLAFDEAFDYAENQGMVLVPGDLVKVPFGKKEQIGVVWKKGFSGKINKEKVKQITEKLPFPRLNENFMNFLTKVSEYNLAPLGNVLDMALPVKNLYKPVREKKNDKNEIKEISAKADLSDDQKKILEKLLTRISGFKPTLLDGVTGSGKTEVYLAAIEKLLKEEDSQVLVLLPEIALTTQLIKRIEKRLGIEPTLWHSSLTPSRRRKNLKDIIEGRAKIVVGARSALFLPYRNLKMIVVDEEHETSYKQEDGVIYHARDMAVLRASVEKIPILLVSATPSIETITNVETGKYEALHLPDRFGGASMPEVETVDMRKEKTAGQNFISEPLRKNIEATIGRGEQVLLYLNRRGYAPLTLCRACGHRLKCPNCSAWLVAHRAKNNPATGKLQCHHCGYTAKLPNECPECKMEESMVPLGPGVQRLDDEVKSFLPDARILVLSSDTVTEVGELESAMHKIISHEVDIIIGTQMAAKGHHFPKLTLVGVIDADLGLEGADLRAAERVYQVLHQVSGRAGREEHPGKVLLQTYMPENRIIQALVAGERDSFISAETGSRKNYNLPPFGKLASVIVSGRQEELVRGWCTGFARTIPVSKDFRVLGPAPAPLTMLRGRYRYRFLIKAPRNTNLQKFLLAWLATQNIPSQLKVKIDIDPYNFT